jgi:uncharacterized GH25 family protein
MKSFSFPKCALFLAFMTVANGTFAPFAQAHDTWLLPKAFRVQAERKTTLALTSGMTFPTLDHAIATDRIQQAVMNLAGETQQLSKYVKGKKSLDFAVNPANVGVAVLSVVLKPRTLELAPKLIQEYLDEIGASDSLKAAWKQPSPSMQWRETYTKYAKTFMFVGAEKFFQNDSAWKVPHGLALEIIPERHPGLLRANDELPVQVLLSGKPLANFPLGLAQAGNKKGILQITDANGRTTFKLPKAAQYLIRGTLLLPSLTNPSEWQSDFATLTIETRKKVGGGFKF